MFLKSVQLIELTLMLTSISSKWIGYQRVLEQMKMNRFEVKSSTLGKRAASREMKYQVSKGLNDTQSEVRNLFKKLSSWKEESQRELSDIINGCTYNINKGIKDLVEEVCDLKTQLSLKTEECNDLLETVDKLNGEIRHMSDGFKAQPTPKPEGNHIRNSQENDAHEVEMEDKDGQDTDNLEGNIEDPDNQQQSILMDPWNDQLQHSNDDTLNECTNEYVDDLGSNDDGELREQEKRSVKQIGINPIPNPGIKEAMEAYLTKNYCHNQDITFTEANRQKEQ